MTTAKIVEAQKLASANKPPPPQTLFACAKQTTGHYIHRTSWTRSPVRLTEVNTVDVFRFTVATARYRRERP